jgi:hypothetical protein
MDAADFLDRLYGVRGIKADFDAVALHPYAADAGELRNLVESVRQVMLRHGDRRGQLFVTEMGWGSQARSPVSFEVGLREQARQLRAAYGRPLPQRLPVQAEAGLARLRADHSAREIALTISTIAAGAFCGEPASKGGSGSYSIPSWIACATSGPASRPTR